MATGLTFDTGALIGLEKRGHRIRRVFVSAVQDAITMTVPTVVLVEWWRGGMGSRGREEILRALFVEPLDVRTAKIAADAMAAVAGATPGQARSARGGQARRRSLSSAHIRAFVCIDVRRYYNY